MAIARENCDTRSNSIPSKPVAMLLRLHTNVPRVFHTVHRRMRERQVVNGERTRVKHTVRCWNARNYAEHAWHSEKFRRTIHDWILRVENVDTVCRKSISTCILRKIGYE